MKMMLAALAATVTLAFGAPAFAANDIDMSTIKCKDFINSNKDEIGMILVWLEKAITPRKTTRRFSMSRR